MANKKARKNLQALQEFKKHDKEYALFVSQTRAKWLSQNRLRSNNVLETLTDREREEVGWIINRWEHYITPLAEEWWKARGYGIIWPTESSQNCKYYLLSEHATPPV